VTARTVGLSTYGGMPKPGLTYGHSGNSAETTSAETGRRFKFRVSFGAAVTEAVAEIRSAYILVRNTCSTLTVVLSEHLNTLKQPFARCTFTSDRSMADRTATLSMYSSRSRQRGRATTPRVESVDGAPAEDGRVCGSETKPPLATTSPTA